MLFCTTHTHIIENKTNKQTKKLVVAKNVLMYTEKVVNISYIGYYIEYSY